MMFPKEFQVKEHQSLKNFNTFGVEVFAEYYLEISSEEALENFFRWKISEAKAIPYLILGGGSNMLLCQDVKGFVLKLRLKGRSVDFLDDNRAVLTAAASENWHETVMSSVENGLGGMENMALIPGDCGTSPVQNIGAYGIELKDIFLRCRAFDTKNLVWKTFEVAECDFAYRESFFKKNKHWVITEVSYLLTRKEHQLVTSYGSISEELEGKLLTPKSIAEAVMSIRRAKLPDPKVKGNAGSFFKNPVVDIALAQYLKSLYADMPQYEVANGVKIPAGWLIEHSGWKGKTIGSAGVHEKQALVLVNADGHATGKEIFQLSEKIIESIREKFNITLEREVNCLYCG